MSDKIAQYRIDGTHRVTVYVDPDPVNPRTDYAVATGALTVRSDSRRIDVEPCVDFPGDLERADEGLDDDDVIRWAHIFHGIELVFDGRTYWWVKPSILEHYTPVGTLNGQPLYKLGAGDELVDRVGLQHAIIEGDQAEYEAWASGEVYGLAVEEFTLTAPLAVDEGGDLIIDMDALADARAVRQVVDLS